MYRMVDGVLVWGDAEEKTVEQMKNCMRNEHVVGARLMADSHLGYAVPIGGVLAYEGAMSPSGVGYDISCGNMAVRLDAPGEEVRARIKSIMDDVFSTLSFGIGRKNREEVDHDLFYDDPAWEIPEVAALRELARAQLGTVGSGNHYCDVMIDELGRPWVAVHFGSRGFGYKIASHYIRLGGGKDGMLVDPVVLDSDTDLAREYVAAMKLAGRYAYAGREWVCGRVARLVGAPIVESIHVHHNYAWEEEHNGKDVWVVRKGATPLASGAVGYIGGSMGDDAVIVRGLAHAETAASFASAPHGAGRVMSRTEAAGKRKKGHRSAGKITREMMLEWLRPRGVELRGAGVDESPHVYKRLKQVLAHHEGIEVVHTLRPIGVAMAGEDIFDPFRD